MRSYKMFCGQLLNDAMRAKRLTKSRRMIKLIGAGRLQKVLFTNEQIFTVQSVRNRQNDRQLLKLGAPSSKNNHSQSFPVDSYGMEWHMRIREDSISLY